MAFLLGREVDSDREVFADESETTADCPHCGGDEVKLDDQGHPTCGECGAPLFVNEDPAEEGDEDGNADDFADYLADLDDEMGDGTE